MTKTQGKIWDAALEKAIEIIDQNCNGNEEHDSELHSIIAEILEYKREFEEGLGIEMKDSACSIQVKFLADELAKMDSKNI